jgi:photosystem II stability/assembly factor-like uncharacterized protein
LKNRSHASLTTLLAALSLLLPGTAGAERWVSLGPHVEQLARDVEIGPAGPSELYGVHATGVTRSADGGHTWQVGDVGLAEAPDLLAELLADPHRPGALYLALTAGGVYRSFDRGAHWRPAADRGLPEVLRPSDLEAHPTHPETLYLATFTDWIFVSEDRGDSWRPAGSETDPDDQIRDLAFDPADPGTLYAVGENDDGREAFPIAFRSGDGGASWQPLDMETALGFEAFPTAVVVAAGGPGAAFIATRGGGIIRSDDGGATWSRADAGLPVEEESERATVRALVAHPTDPSVLYAATDSRGETPDGVFRTTDGGESWERWGEWPADEPGARDLEIHADDPSLVLAAPGPYLSPVGGDGPWRSRRPVLPGTSLFVAVHPHDPNTFYNDPFIHSGDVRLLWTRDGGANWEPFAQNLPPEPGFQAHDVVVDPRDPDTVYLPGKTVFKSEDGGLTWAERSGGLDPINGVGNLVVSPADSEVLYAWNAFVLYRSLDGAESWAPVFEGGDTLVSSFAFDPGSPEVLYLGTAPLRRPGSVGELCRSGDGGDSWTCAPVRSEDAGVGSLAVDPSDPSRIFLVELRADGDFEVLRSRDGGATWSSASAGLPSGGIGELVLADGVLWVATHRRGVFRSADGGDSWLPVNAGLDSLRVRDLAHGPGGLLAATTRGVFRLDESPGAGDPLPPTELPWITDPALPGFRVKARIDQGGGASISGTKEPVCIPETVCLSGALPGRSELFVRVVGPKPNGFLWPTLVKFSTSRIEVWVQQLGTGELRYYELRGASPGFDELPGLFDRFGFLPD